MPNRSSEYRFFLLSLGLLTVYLLALAFLNKGILDTGDGLNHHFIARYAWQYPRLLLDHWGKPLYILFSSPFAQLGMTGTILFNITVFAGTAFLLRDIVLKLNLPHTWLIPVILLSSPQYFDNVFAGLTETFFAFHLALILFFVFRGKWLLAALAGSFILYSRSEGMLVLALLGALLLWRKQWKAVPFLVFGFCVYGLLGKLMLNDTWWYFHNDPYKGNAWYGSGPWYHFLLGSVDIFGFPALLLAIYGLIVAVDVLIKDKPKQFPELFFSGLVFFLFLAIHSALWFFGKKGSLGLLRVMVCVEPVFVLFVFYGISRFRLESRRLLQVVTLVFTGLALLQPHFYRKYPLQPSKEELLYGGAGKWMKTYFEKSGKKPDVVAMHHPTIFYYAGLTPFDEEHSPDFWHAPPPFTRIKKGDMIAWDSYFGPNEGLVPLEKIEADTSLHLLRCFAPVSPINTIRGVPHQVRIYVRQQVKSDTAVVMQHTWPIQEYLHDKNVFLNFGLPDFSAYRDDAWNEYFIEYDVDYQVLDRERISNLFLVLTSADPDIAFSPALPLNDTGRVHHKLWIPLSQPEAKYLPVKNYFWMQGSGKVKIFAVTARLKRRTFRAL